MKFKIDHKIVEKFPGLTIGVVICKNLNNSGIQEEVQKEIREQEIEEATKELKELVQKFCGGNVAYQILDDKHFETGL